MTNLRDLLVHQARLERLAQQVCYRSASSLPEALDLDAGWDVVPSPAYWLPRLIAVRAVFGGLWFLGVQRDPRNPFVVAYAFERLVAEAAAAHAARPRFPHTSTAVSLETSSTVAQAPDLTGSAGPLTAVDLEGT